MTAMVALVLVAIGAYALFLFLVAWFTVHPPRIPIFAAPAMMGEPQEEFTCLTEDGVSIKGWHVPHNGGTTVVFCHGFLTNRTEFLPLVAPYRRAGFACVLFDFRSHGWSGGRRCTFGIEEARDLRAVVDWVRARSPGTKIVLFGSSMGAATAVFTAQSLAEPVSALVLDGPYARLDEAGKGWWSYIGMGAFSTLLAPTVWFGRALTGHRPQSADTTKALEALGSTPVLLLYGAKDHVVPRPAAERCVEATNHGRVEWFESSGHSEARFKEPERYLAVGLEFLRNNGLGTQD
ncbi:MAG: alpha/beta fold hydrolase [Fimbriimonadaceae bacterium]|nr:alpha/beta fold hydrolase [Fimbriimonadaceae bacterium]QYK58235.1 MAG: alpha/beta fold hydrolase [Fimbriimonadaceae bacterium]